MGGGLGHLTRLRAVCNTLNIKPIILSASKFCDDKRVIPDSFEVISPDENIVQNHSLFSNWVRDTITELQPEILYVDAFPGGVLGELCDLPALEKSKNTYISRILKVDTYKKRLQSRLPKFHNTLLTEVISDSQLNWINSISDNTEKLDLIYPKQQKKYSIDKNTWLILHSGTYEETNLLYSHAVETAEIENVSPNFVVVTPTESSEQTSNFMQQENIYPADELFDLADRIFSGAGFNIIKQIKSPNKHVILPMERALDDQYLRYKLYKIANNC